MRCRNAININLCNIVFGFPKLFPCWVLNWNESIPWIRQPWWLMKYVCMYERVCNACINGTYSNYVKVWWRNNKYKTSTLYFLSHIYIYSFGCLKDSTRQRSFSFRFISFHLPWKCRKNKNKIMYKWKWENHSLPQLFVLFFKHRVAIPFHSHREYKPNTVPKLFIHNSTHPIR